MSTHLPEEWGDPREHDPEDVAELLQFQAFLRKAAAEPRSLNRTWGDLYDECYGHEDRLEDTDLGRLMGDGSAMYLNDDRE